MLFVPDSVYRRLGRRVKHSRVSALSKKLKTRWKKVLQKEALNMIHLLEQDAKIIVTDRI